VPVAHLKDFIHACSHQAARLTSPRGGSRSQSHRALLALRIDINLNLLYKA
jgi:hypothetical protein